MNNKIDLNNEKMKNHPPSPLNYSGKTQLPLWRVTEHI